MAKQAFLTCSFRLRKPTRKKQAVLDQVLRQYTDAVQALLDWAWQHLDTVRERGVDAKGNYTETGVRGCLPTSAAWPMPLHSALKDGAFADASAMVASYLELLKLDAATGWPTAYIHVEDERADALAELGSLELVGKVGALRPTEEVAAVARQVERLTDEAHERDLAARAKRRPKETVRPLTYTRGRDFDLLLSSDMTTPYIFLPLLPSQDPTVAPITFQGNLLCLWRNGQAIDAPLQTGKRRGGLLLPLELGKRGGRFHWQFRKFLLAILDGNGVPKSAKLIRKANGRYHLNVSVAFPAESAYHAQRWLGFADNVLYSLAYALIDETGAVLQTQRKDSGLAQLKMDAAKRVAQKQRSAQAVTYLDYKRRAQEEALHVLINYLLDIAVHNQAGVVMMSGGDILRKNSGKLKRIWAKAEQIVAYKCKVRGIPCRTGMFGAAAHRICDRCGGDCRVQPPEAVCRVCGARRPVDVLKAINIARRVLYKMPAWVDRGGYRGFHNQFRSAD